MAETFANINMQDKDITNARFIDATGSSFVSITASSSINVPTITSSSFQINVRNDINMTGNDITGISYLSASSATIPTFSSGFTVEGQINMDNNKITNVAEPVTSSDVATKNYVDNDAAVKSWEQATFSYDNLAAGSLTMASTLPFTWGPHNAGKKVFINCSFTLDYYTRSGYLQYFLYSPISGYPLGQNWDYSAIRSSIEIDDQVRTREGFQWVEEIPEDGITHQDQYILWVSNNAGNSSVDIRNGVFSYMVLK